MVAITALLALVFVSASIHVLSEPTR
jgi:hypothetical protein